MLSSRPSVRSSRRVASPFWARRPQRDDRRRALPQHPRRRLRRRGVPREPQGGVRCGCPRLRLHRRRPRRGRPRVVCVPASAVIDAVRTALDAGVRAICVISAGFAEIGSEGEERQRDLLALVRAHGARLLGPNCLGISSTAVRLNATFASRAPVPGNIGFSSQSGALGLALLEASVSRGIGLSAFVSIGNKADISSNDLLEWWEDDDATALVLLYVESFGNPRRFGTLARRVARSKPILAVKSGTTRRGARAGRLAYRRPGGLGSGGRRALPPGRRHPGGVPRGADRRRGAPVVAADAARPAGRGPDERGWPRDPLRRRVRGSRVGASAGRRRDVDALEGMLPAEASVANPVDMLGSATDVLSRDAAGAARRPRDRRRDRPLRPPAVATAGRRRPRSRTRAPNRAAKSRSWPSFMTAEGIPGAASRRRRRRVQLSGVGGSRARPRRPACGLAPATSRLGSRPRGIDRARQPRSSRRSWQRTRSLARPGRDEAASPRLRVSPRAGTRCDSAEEAVPSRESSDSRRRQDGDRRSPQDGDGRYRTRPLRRGSGSSRRRPDRTAGGRATDDRGRRGAPGRPRAGPRLRPARGVRTGRCVRRAHRGGGVPDRAAYGRRRRGARPRRKGWPARTRIQRGAASRRNALVDLLHRLARLGRPSGGSRARSQPGTRAPRSLRRRRRAHAGRPAATSPGSRPGSPAHASDLSRAGIGIFLVSQMIVP